MEVVVEELSLGSFEDFFAREERFDDVELLTSSNRVRKRWSSAITYKPLTFTKQPLMMAPVGRSHSL